VTTAANNETTIIRSIGEQVHKALHAAETVLLGILVLVRPGLVGGNIGATLIEFVSVNYITQIRVVGMSYLGNWKLIASKETIRSSSS
jgi:hypothetical protein